MGFAKTLQVHLMIASQPSQEPSSLTFLTSKNEGTINQQPSNHIPLNSQVTNYSCCPCFSTPIITPPFLMNTVNFLPFEVRILAHWLYY